MIKEYCRCGPYPLKVTSSRARHPLVKGAGHIGPLLLEFRGWPFRFMASIPLRGPQHLAPEVVPGASLHFEALTPECGRECQETGDCGPARHVRADCSRVARATTPGPPPQPHGWVRLGLEVSRLPHFWVGGLASAEFPRGVEFQGSLAPCFSPHP